MRAPDALRPAGGLHVVQVAYHVPDPAAAAARFAADFGWGPFYLFEHIPLARSSHRGRPAPFDHTSAYGQAGEVMVELITQHGDEPSAVRERFAADQSGLHHIACFVPDLDAAIAQHVAAGGTPVLDAETVDGVRFSMLEVPPLEHLVEFYEPVDALLRFYAFIRRQATDWDGSRPVRRPGR